MKKFLAAIVALVVLTASVTAVLASSYVGNSTSRKFHYADCASARKMNQKNRVYFNSRDEAVKAGYVACKKCKP